MKRARKWTDADPFCAFLIGTVIPRKCCKLSQQYERAETRYVNKQKLIDSNASQVTVDVSDWSMGKEGVDV